MFLQYPGSSNVQSLSLRVHVFTYMCYSLSRPSLLSAASKLTLRWGGQAGCGPSAALPQFASVAQREEKVKGLGLGLRREGTHPPTAWPGGRVAWEVAELQRKAPGSCGLV